MVQSRIGCYAILVLVFLIFQVQYSDAVESVPSINKSLGEDVKVEEKDVKEKEVAQNKDQKVALVNQATSNKTGNITSKHVAESSAPALAATTIHPAVQHANEIDNSSLNIGALKRAFIVTVGLCGLVMMYIIFRSLRVNKSRPQMVRKYGILAHRQDVEMRPLPLDEDDEDDTTLFDASNISAQRLET